jgi:hypothetical protein
MLQNIAQNHGVKPFGYLLLDTGAFHISNDDAITYQSRLFSSDGITFHTNHSAASIYQVLTEEAVGTPYVQHRMSALRETQQPGISRKLIAGIDWKIITDRSVQFFTFFGTLDAWGHNHNPAFSQQ